MEVAIKKSLENIKKIDKRALLDGQLTLGEAFQLFQDVPMEIAIYDLDGNYKYVNHYYSPDEEVRNAIIGKDDEYYFNRIGISNESIEKRKEYFRIALNEKRTVRFTEKLVVPERNKSKYYKRVFQPIFERNRRDQLSGICLFGSDLTAVIHGQQELKYLAYHDKLTALKNRDAFYEQLDQILIDLPRDGKTPALSLA